VRLMVLTAAVWPTEDIAFDKLWIFIESCAKFGIAPHLYGIGHSFPGYISMKLDMQLDYLIDKGSDFTHVLYTDSWDAIFTAPLDEIIEKYQDLGSPPILSSAYLDLGNESNMEKYSGCFQEGLVYRYPNVGGHLSEIPAIIDAFTKMNRNTGDDCFSWYDAWKEGWFRPQLDSGCEIFQVTDENTEVDEGIEGLGFRNTVTESYPCILHLCGGYTDPDTGKDDRLEPWAKELGIL